jgi:GAF domain-containing protein
LSDLQAAVAAGVLGAEEGFRSLLQATVEVARAIFKAKAASVFLLDEETEELVFEAVAGEGSDSLVGVRFPADTGVAGWVLVTRQPLVVDDLTKDTRFSREAAESTGFVPKGLMAVPLLAEEKALGVLEVLDRPQQSRFSLAEMDLLGLFANQAAIALDLLQRARRAQAALEGSGELGALARIAARLEGGDERRRAAPPPPAAGLDLLAALEKLT